MDKTLCINLKPADEMSDAMSTAASYAQFEEETSPSNAQSPTSSINDEDNKNKKIRKKRNAYQKIDDDIRLRLLEAVQKGETLKSAAKRYNVNYSSAKSIFHIFRKEGRILKKATQEQNFMFPGQQENENHPYFGQNQMRPNMGFQGGFYNNQMPQQMQQMQQMQMQQMQQPNQMLHTQLGNHQQQPFMFKQALEETNPNPNNPFINLAGDFADLLKIGNNNNVNKNSLEEMMKAKAQAQAHAQVQAQAQAQAQMNNLQAKLIPMMSPTAQFTKLQQQYNQQMHGMSPMMQHSLGMEMPQMVLANKTGSSSALVSPANKFDNFYMNYSNSPLSGKIVREGSESGSNRYMRGEFDSFSDMVTAFQTQPNLADTLTKGDLSSLSKLGATPKMADNKSQSIEELGWHGNLENAAMDTFKSFIDAQMILNNAFKKASLLNNLVAMQKGKVDGSPTQKMMSFQGN